MNRACGDLQGGENYSEIKMRNVLRAMLFSVVLAMTATARAHEHAGKDDAVAMAHKVIAYIKANGKDKAIAEVNVPKGRFVDRDLYVTVGDGLGMVLAHGGNPRLVGKNLSEMKDVDGKSARTSRDGASARGGAGAECAGAR